MNYLLLLLTSLTICRALAQPKSADKLDEYMRAQVNALNFNGNVLMAKNGQIIYQKAFGYANYDTKAPLDLNSVFQLCSVSKQFAAMSILLLKEQGKLSLSDSLRKFFPELPYPNITIQQLLIHTSGLPDHEATMETIWNHKKVASNQDMVQFLAHQKPPIHFKPGQKYEYSNTGYALLSAIVEKVSGQSWGEFTNQSIFKPLGMNHSRVYITRRSQGEVIPNYAYGYVYSDSLKRYLLPDSLPQYTYVYWLDGIHGDDGINSTLSDLLKWDRALKNHTLLPQATQQEMLTGQAVINTVSKSYYGYGVVVGERDNRDYIWHSGGWPGYRTNLTRYVTDDVTIIVLSNNESNPDRISNDLADILFNKPVTLPRKRAVIQVDEKILESYVGVYEGKWGSNPKASFTIIRQDNQLFEQLTGGQKLAIFPETETKFFFKAINAQLEFIRDASGQVAKRILTQNGQTFEAKKIK